MHSNIGKTFKEKDGEHEGVAVAHVENLIHSDQTLLAPDVDDEGIFRGSKWVDDVNLVQVGTKTIDLSKYKK